jgi:CheY-like chemotaxis protein
MYPAENLPDYSREEFIEDLPGEHEKEIRGCLTKGAHKVQIDFTEGRRAVKIDPSGALLNSFIELNNLALDRFSEEERKYIGVHTYPGSDRDSTHSAAERPDVLVCDIGMPGEDGYTFIRRLRSIEKTEGNALPAVALSAYARSDDRTQAIRSGFQNHLAKPVEPAELLAVIGSLANRKLSS